MNTNIYKACSVIAAFSLLMVACNCTNQPQSKTQTTDKMEWQQTLKETIPAFGHRNWIIVADKAFPRQNAPGMVYIDTHEKLIPVLTQVLKMLDSTTHVKPVIYTDKELQFIPDSLASGISDLRKKQNELFAGKSVQTILHDSVFAKMDKASSLFKVLVLKTDEVLPYTSVFLELDCAYWNADKEAELRKIMAAK